MSCTSTISFYFYFYHWMHIKWDENCVIFKCLWLIITFASFMLRYLRKPKKELREWKLGFKTIRPIHSQSLTPNCPCTFLPPLTLYSTMIVLWCPHCPSRGIPVVAFCRKNSMIVPVPKIVIIRYYCRPTYIFVLRACTKKCDHNLWEGMFFYGMVGWIPS